MSDNPSLSWCEFTRSIVDLPTAPGFTINELDVFYQKGTPKFT